MPEPDIIRVNNKFRADLLRKERAGATDMVRFYGQSWQRIKANLDIMTAKIQAARAEGKEVGQSWLFQEDRLKILLAQTEAEINRFAQFAERSIVQQQGEAVLAAQSHAQQLMLTGLGEAPPSVTLSFAQLPTEAIQNLVGFSSDGAPLADLLKELAPEAVQDVRKALITGVALGKGPREIARQVRLAMGGNLARALTISRSTVMDSYREAAYQTYQANSDVLEGWVRHEACDRRTCPACFALHGQVYKLNERFERHPNCRGSLLPRTKTWEQLGFKGISETRPAVTKGPALFEQLSDVNKMQVLGPAAFRAYRAGEIRLKDYPRTWMDRKWGEQLNSRSLTQILGKERRDQWIRRAAQPQQEDLPAAAAGS